MSQEQIRKERGYYRTAFKSLATEMKNKMSQEELENLAEQGEQIREEIFCMCMNYLRTHSKDELDDIVTHAADVSTFLGSKNQKD